jgi:hypothetical protein
VWCYAGSWQGTVDVGCQVPGVELLNPAGGGCVVMLYHRLLVHFCSSGWHSFVIMQCDAQRGFHMSLGSACQQHCVLPKEGTSKRTCCRAAPRSMVVELGVHETHPIQLHLPQHERNRSRVTWPCLEACPAGDTITHAILQTQHHTRVQHSSYQQNGWCTCRCYWVNGGPVNWSKFRSRRRYAPCCCVVR